MNYRIMRVIVFFDLPMESNDEKREYMHFRKFLIKNGFLKMQKSVYAKLAVNRSVALATKMHIQKNLPPNGLIQVLEVTENQYSDIEYMLGESSNNVLDTVERVVIYE